MIPGALLAVALAASLVSGCATTPDNASSIIRTTTKISGAGVVGTDRDTTNACPNASAPDSPAGATRPLDTASGPVQIPTDPQRIVVLGTSALDAVCAVGLWPRVVGLTTDQIRPGVAAEQPTYLGTGIAKLPNVMTSSQPDAAAIGQLHPDLILATSKAAGENPAALRALAPTVIAGEDLPWRDQFSALAAGMNRSGAAAGALHTFDDETKALGAKLSAATTQASIIEFTDKQGLQSLDDTTFGVGIAKELGVGRPPAQRGPAFRIDESHLRPAEGDLIYILFAEPAAQVRAKKTMTSDAWHDLSAVTDSRTFVVDDALWHTKGLTAARAIRTDLKNSLNAYVD